MWLRMALGTVAAIALVLITAALTLWIHGDPNPAFPGTVGHHSNELDGKQSELLDDAIRALGRVESATQVGTNYIEYSRLLGDAKAAVNEAARAVPTGHARAQSLANAMKAYELAATVWRKKNTTVLKNVDNMFDQMLSADLMKAVENMEARAATGEEFTRDRIACELVEVHSQHDRLKEEHGIVRGMKHEDAIQSIWRVASHHLETARP